MNIGIIGSGRVGGTLGRRFAEQGHELVFGVRSQQSAKVQALISELGGRARAVPVAEVATTTDIVFLTTPWGAAEQAIADAGDGARQNVDDLPVGRSRRSAAPLYDVLVYRESFAGRARRVLCGLRVNSRVRRLHRLRVFASLYAGSDSNRWLLCACTPQVRGIA